LQRVQLQLCLRDALLRSRMEAGKQRQH